MISSLLYNPNSSALPTLKATVSNPENKSLCQSVRIFVDCGAQRTLIQTPLVQSLQLQTKGQLVCGLTSFNRSETPQVYDLVTFHLHLGIDLLPISAFVSP